MSTKERRPRIVFSQALFDRICERIAAGGKDSSVMAICKCDGMPRRHTFMAWTERTDKLRAQYERARLAQEDSYFDEILEIADTEPDIERAKLKIDARKWVRARMNRKKFGDKLGVDGGEDGKPINLVLNGSDVHG